MKKQLEKGEEIMLDFRKLKNYFAKQDGREKNIMPVVVQNAATKEVLMLAYANKEAMDMTLKTGLATFWSRSRKKIWVKGKTSGNWLEVVKVLPDCDGDALLYIVKLPKGGGACHKKDKKGNYHQSCFHHRLALAAKKLKK